MDEAFDGVMAGDICWGFESSVARAMLDRRTDDVTPSGGFVDESEEAAEAE